MTAYALTIDEPDLELLNTNRMRGHTRYFAPKIKAWRALGFNLANATELPRPIRNPVRIWVEVRYPNGYRRDTTNFFPTAKALVDGLVEAGVLRDDRDGTVEGPWLRCVYPNGPLRIRVVLQEVPLGDLGRPLTLDELRR